MVRHVHIDPFNGVAGDMLLAALVHLGAPRDRIVEALNDIRLPGVGSVQLVFPEVEQHGVRGLGLEVALDSPPAEASRSYTKLCEAISTAPLPEPARATALEALRRVAKAEAVAHGTDLERVRFGELGGVDSVVDVVGVSLAVHLLDVGSLSCGPLPIGRGEIRTQPAALPSPAPSTLELLHGLPTVGVDVAMELVTPTGVGLARALSSFFGAPPPMALRAVGTGFGKNTASGRPNCLRLLLGDVDRTEGICESLLVLEANLDDLPAEVLATLIDACLAAGALDAWLTPALMKKGRPGHVLSALCRDGAAEGLEKAIFRHSSTLGVRKTRVEREALERIWEEVQTPWGPVRIKVGFLGKTAVNRAPEFEDCRRLAEQEGVPVKDVYAAALARAICR